MAEYDEKNRELYDNNTEKIYLALDKIRQDKKLKVTKSQLINLTGLHRNTFDPKGPRAWVGTELELIKKQRQDNLEKVQLSTKQEESNLQDLLDQSKLEILHWFTLHSGSKRELDKLRHRLKREIDSLEWYKTELKKERKAKEALEEKVELLESIINK